MDVLNFSTSRSEALFRKGNGALHKAVRQPDCNVLLAFFSSSLGYYDVGSLIGGNISPLLDQTVRHN
jgi:hypothetical protein